jgi:hypothetical protein
MPSKHALPLLALMLPACGKSLPPPQPIPAVAQERQCPAYPLPPADLLKVPVTTFLGDYEQQSKPSNSTN